LKSFEHVLLNAPGPEMKYQCRQVRGGEFVLSRTGGASASDTHFEAPPCRARKLSGGLALLTSEVLGSSEIAGGSLRQSRPQRHLRRTYVAANSLCDLTQRFHAGLNYAAPAVLGCGAQSAMQIGGSNRKAKAPI
jgi:hypothetical protein